MTHTRIKLVVVGLFALLAVALPLITGGNVSTTHCMSRRLIRRLFGANRRH